MAAKTANLVDAVDNILNYYTNTTPSLKSLCQQLYLLDELKGWCITTCLLSKDIALISVLDDDHSIVLSRTVKIKTTK